MVQKELLKTRNNKCLSKMSCRGCSFNSRVRIWEVESTQLDQMLRLERQREKAWSRHHMEVWRLHIRRIRRLKIKQESKTLSNSTSRKLTTSQELKAKATRKAIFKSSRTSNEAKRRASSARCTVIRVISRETSQIWLKVMISCQTLKTSMGSNSNNLSMTSSLSILRKELKCQDLLPIYVKETLRLQHTPCRRKSKMMSIWCLIIQFRPTARASTTVKLLQTPWV